MSDDFQIATVDKGSVTLRAVQLGGGQFAQLLLVAAARITPIDPPEKLAITSGAVVTLSPPGGATNAVFVNDKYGNDLRWYWGGSTPTTGTTGNGPVLAAGDYLELDLATFANFKAIAVAASTTGHVYYWKVV